MASQVYDELLAEYGRMPTDEEVRLRLERKLGRDHATASAEDATFRTVAAAGSLDVCCQVHAHNSLMRP